MHSETVAKSRRQQDTETRTRRTRRSSRPRLENTFDVNSDETNDANDGVQDAAEQRNVNPTGRPAENYRFMVRNTHTEEKLKDESIRKQG